MKLLLTTFFSFIITSTSWSITEVQPGLKQMIQEKHDIELIHLNQLHHQDIISSSSYLDNTIIETEYKNGIKVRTHYKGVIYIQDPKHHQETFIYPGGITFIKKDSIILTIYQEDHIEMIDLRNDKYEECYLNDVTIYQVENQNSISEAIIPFPILITTCNDQNIYTRLERFGSVCFSIDPKQVHSIPYKKNLPEGSMLIVSNNKKHTLIHYGFPENLIELITHNDSRYLFHTETKPPTFYKKEKNSPIYFNRTDIENLLSNLYQTE